MVTDLIAAPTAPTDGSTDCDATTTYAATCTASCNNGFHLTGTATLTCGDSNNDGIGDFSALPTCTG